MELQLQMGLQQQLQREQGAREIQEREDNFSNGKSERGEVFEERGDQYLKREEKKKDKTTI